MLVAATLKSRMMKYPADGITMHISEWKSIAALVLISRYHSCVLNSAAIAVLSLFLYKVHGFIHHICTKTPPPKKGGNV